VTRRFLAALVASCCALLAFASFASAQTLYGADGAGGNPSTNLYLLDPASGAVLQTVGPIGFGVTGLAVDPSTGTLYGVTGARDATNPGFLITVNKTTGAGTPVGDLLPGTTSAVADITFTPDATLFGWSEGSDDLVTINKATGAATVVGESGISTAGSGLASNAAGVLFFAGDRDNGELSTVDRTTGAVTTVATMNGTANRQIAALAFDAAGTLFGARLDDAGGTNPRPADLVTIDPTSGAINSRGPSIDRLDAIAFEVLPPGTTPPATTPGTAPKAKKKKKCKKGFVRKRGKCVKKKVKPKQEPGFTG
jgi:hypothetical protein